MARHRVGRTRRRFLQGSLGLVGIGLLSGCGMVAPPPPPRRPTQVSRIGTLAPGGLDQANVAAFLQGLRDLGWVEGETLAVEHRFARANDALVARVAELIDLKVDVIVTTGNEVIRVARSATGVIPIVMTISDDPVAAGLVSSLAHPGGNVTGLTSLGTELGAKRLQLLKEASPGIARVAIVWDAGVQGRLGEDPTLGVAASALGLQIELRPFGAAGLQLGEAFEAAAASGADAVLLLTGHLTAATDIFLPGIIAKTRLPTMVGDSELARAGGLLAYGPSVPDLFRRAAVYVDKILKGAKPADLPVEQPTTFEFVINLKTAQALGLTIPQAVLQQATEIIQ